MAAKWKPAGKMPALPEFMNPLVKKEIRLLLPGVAVCCALGLTNFLFQFDSNGSLEGGGWFALAFVFCGGMAVMLALSSFGAEMSSGTFSNLLAQPIPRQKIWDTKIVLLAVALLLVGIFWSACGLIRLRTIAHNLDWLDLFTGVGVFGLAVFSGGLWTVLLLRQVAAAFWFTVLVPGFILVIIAGLFADHSGEFVNGIVAGVLGLYSLAGFFFARWLFFRAQDTAWTGGTIVMPEMRGLPAWLSLRAAKAIGHPRAALWRKEIQLHQSQFVLAGALAILHLGVIATRHWGHFRRNSTTEMVLEGFWVLWLVLPMLIGCAAVAEERKLGTHESQLCLPARRRTQFAVKLAVAIGLSLALGVAMPLLLEGSKILPDTHLNGGFAPNWWTHAASAPLVLIGYCLATLSGLLPLLTLAGITLLIGGVSFYASTLARNTLQTLAPAVAGVVLAFFLIMVATIPRQSDFGFDFLWQGPLPYFIVFPSMALTLLALAYVNYQHVLTGWKLGRRNLLALASVFALTVTLTSAIYHRAWEKLTPFEPPHGPARLTLANPAQLDTDGGGASVRLPDGRIWMAGNWLDPRLNGISYLLDNFKMALTNGGFIDGTNWLTVKRAASDLVGIKTDGTLWVSEKPRRVTGRQGQWKINEDEMRNLVPFGADTNWNSLEPWGDWVFLTKTDGTLWRWGPFDYRYEAGTNRWPGLRAFTPERLGNESNWKDVCQMGHGICFRKMDGSIWSQFYSSVTNGQPYLEIFRGYQIAKTFDDNALAGYRSTASVYHGLGYRVGVRDDGTFRIWAHEVPVTNIKPRYTTFVWSNTDLQIGSGTNWLAVADGGDQIITLKDDGTLWLWNFHRSRNWTWDSNQLDQEIFNTVPARLGTHSDWIAISGTTALAADGSLWFWPLGESHGTVYDENRQPILQLLGTTHKPQFLGSVFDNGN